MQIKLASNTKVFVYVAFNHLQILKKASLHHKSPFPKKYE